jgi:hypothetical protein
MKRYHFSVGDSTDGPIGLCAAVYATSKERAVQVLRERLNQVLGGCGEFPVGDSAEQVEYINVYVAPERIGLADLDEWVPLAVEDQA